MLKPKTACKFKMTRDMQNKTTFLSQLKLSINVILQRHNFELQLKLSFHKLGFSIFLNVYFRLSKVRKGGENMQEPSAPQYCEVTWKYPRRVLPLPCVRSVSWRNLLYTSPLIWTGTKTCYPLLIFSPLLSPSSFQFRFLATLQELCFFTNCSNGMFCLFP